MRLHKLKTWYNSTSLLAWSLIGFILLILIFFPSQVLLANMEFWNYDPIQLVPYALVGALLSIISWWLVRNKQPRWLSIVLVILFWIVLLSDVFSPVALSPFDGTVTESTEPVDQTLIEVLVVILVTSVVYALRKKLDTLVAFGLVVVMVFTGINWLQIATAKLTLPNQKHANTESSQQLPNIYHIVLDEMQTDVAKQLILEKQMEDDFLGFTLFENNSSNYPYTHASLPSYMTSTLFDISEEYQDWQYSFSEVGLAPWLERHGYTQWQYAAEGRWIPEQTTHETYLNEVKDTHLGRMFKQSRFAGLWLARILPTFLTNESLQITGLIRESFYPDSVVSDLGGENVAPYISLLMFERLKEDEFKRPSNNHYVYMHAALPHLPYILDENCQIRDGSPGKTAKEYVDQSECALLQTIEYLDQLREQGKYEDSLILIHSDHGDGHNGFITISDEAVTSSRGNRDALVANSKRTEEWLDARSYSLLMIKPPGSTEKFVISDVDTQLLDIYPTIAELVADEMVEAEGDNVFRLNREEEREIQKFFWPSPGEPWGEIYEYEFKNDELVLTTIGEIPLSADVF